MQRFFRRNDAFRPWLVSRQAFRPVWGNLLALWLCKKLPDASDRALRCWSGCRGAVLNGAGRQAMSMQTGRLLLRCKQTRKVVAWSKHNSDAVHARDATPVTPHISVTDKSDAAAIGPHGGAVARGAGRGGCAPRVGRARVAVQAAEEHEGRRVMLPALPQRLASCTRALPGRGFACQGAGLRHGPCRRVNKHREQ